MQMISFTAPDDDYCGRTSCRVSCLLECVTDDWRRAGTLGGGGLERRRWALAVEGRAARLTISHETKSTESTRAVALRLNDGRIRMKTLFLRQKIQNKETRHLSRLKTVYFACSEFI